MILDAATRSLQVALGEAQATTACDIIACYATTSSAGQFSVSAADGASNGTTPVVIVPAPAPGAQLQVNEVRVHNNDTVAHTVLLQFNDAGVVRVIMRQVIAPSGDFLYTPQATSDADDASTLALTLGWGGGMPVTAGTYVFTATAAYPFSIASLDASVGSTGGTITANVRNAGVSVAGLSACAISLLAKTTFTATGANSLVLAGATVDVVLAMTGAPAGAFLCLNGVKL